VRATVYIDCRRMGSFEYEHPVEDGRTIPIPTASEEYESEVVVAVHDGDGKVWMGKAKLTRDGGAPRPTEREQRMWAALEAAKSIVGIEPINAMTRAPTVAQMQALQAALRTAFVR
jgi:hypothetical protein